MHFTYNYLPLGRSQLLLALRLTVYAGRVFNPAGQCLRLGSLRRGQGDLYLGSRPCWRHVISHLPPSVIDGRCWYENPGVHARNVCLQLQKFAIICLELLDVSFYE